MILRRWKNSGLFRVPVTDLPEVLFLCFFTYPEYSISHYLEGVYASSPEGKGIKIPQIF